MKTLVIQNGDISLDSGGRLQFIQGYSKLVQDLTLWLEEPYGIGFTTPNFGSFLTDLVGEDFSANNVSAIQAEIQRVLSLYQQQQLLDLQSAQTLSQLSNWNRSEIINSINSINLSQQTTSIIAQVNITTLANTSSTITLFINSNGVQVQ